jgi:hypothetical protein
MNLWDTTTVDRLAYWFPVAAAVFAAIAGLIGLLKGDCAQGMLEILAGIASAIGIRATGKGSRIRDEMIGNMIVWNGQQAADRAT